MKERKVSESIRDAPLAEPRTKSQATHLGIMMASSARFSREGKKATGAGMDLLAAMRETVC